MSRYARQTRRRAALLAGGDRDRAALAAGLEFDHAGAGREDRMIAAEPGAVARPEARAALAHDDLAAADLLAGEYLHPEVLGVRVAPVAAGAESLLVSHVYSFLADDDLRD